MRVNSGRLLAPLSHKRRGVRGEGFRLRFAKRKRSLLTPDPSPPRGERRKGPVTPDPSPPRGEGRNAIKGLGPLLSLAALPLLLAGFAVQGRTLSQHQKQATVLLTGDELNHETLTVRLSGELRLVLRVEGRPPLAVELPEKITRADAWQVHPAALPVTASLPDGRARWQQEFELEPLQAGQHDLQLEPLHFREDDGPWQHAGWKPFSVRVITSIEKADRAAAHDITAIEEVPPRPSLAAWLLVVAAGLIGSCLAMALWALRRRRLLQVLPLSPEQAALRELERIAALPVATPQEIARCHTHLSDVIRRYLERRFQLPASRQTTPEFLQTMRHAPQLSAEQQELLRDFLQQCDLAKFAPVAPPPEQCHAAAGLARSLIEKRALE